MLEEALLSKVTKPELFQNYFSHVIILNMNSQSLAITKSQFMSLLTLFVYGIFLRDKDNYTNRLRNSNVVERIKLLHRPALQERTTQFYSGSSWYLLY